MKWQYRCLNMTCRFEYIYNYKRTGSCPVCGSKMYSLEKVPDDSEEYD